MKADSLPLSHQGSPILVLCIILGKSCLFHIYSFYCVTFSTLSNIATNLPVSDFNSFLSWTYVYILNNLMIKTSNCFTQNICSNVLLSWKIQHSLGLICQLPPQYTHCITLPISPFLSSLLSHTSQVLDFYQKEWKSFLKIFKWKSWLIFKSQWTLILFFPPAHIRGKINFFRPISILSHQLLLTVINNNEKNNNKINTPMLLNCGAREDS